jgi:hypothetical protein
MEAKEKRELKKEQLRRCLELPCVSYSTGQVVVTLNNRQYVSEELFNDDPLFALAMATDALEDELRIVIAEKRAVLEEIRNGTFRYRIKDGRFYDIGK